MSTHKIWFYLELEVIIPELSSNTPGPSCSKRRWLNELVKGHSLTVLADLIHNILIFFAESYLHFFSKKFQHICVSFDVNLNE